VPHIRSLHGIPDMLTLTRLHMITTCMRSIPHACALFHMHALYSTCMRSIPHACALFHMHALYSTSMHSILYACALFHMHALYLCPHFYLHACVLYACALLYCSKSRLHVSFSDLKDPAFELTQQPKLAQHLKHSGSSNLAGNSNLVGNRTYR
jgi:hypothetical protein